MNDKEFPKLKINDKIEIVDSSGTKYLCDIRDIFKTQVATTIGIFPKANIIANYGQPEDYYRQRNYY